MSRSRSLAALSFVAVTAMATSARADDKKEAQALFTQGLKLADSGDAKGALAAFRAAYEKSPNFRVLYNIAQVCSRLQDPVCTVRTYEQYLREGGSNIPQKKREAVEAEMTSLRRTLGSITINVKKEAEGSEIYVDDVSVGRAPLPGPVTVAVGAHKIVARLLPKSKEVERSVNIAIGGQTLTVEIIEPVRDPDPPTPAAESVAPPPPDKPAPPAETRSFPLVPWAVTGGFAVLTIGSGVVAAVTYSSFQDKKREFPIERAELDSSQSTARTFFIATSILGAATIVSGAIATYFTITRPKARANITLGFAASGVAVQGAFP